MNLFPGLNLPPTQPTVANHSLEYSIQTVGNIPYAQIISKQPKVTIQSLEYFIQTVGNNAKVQVIHLIKNHSEEDCNVSISLNLDDESAVVGYSFKNHNGEFISQLKEKRTSKDRTNGCNSKWIFNCFDGTKER